MQNVKHLALLANKKYGRTILYFLVLLVTLKKKLSNIPPDRTQECPSWDIGPI